jgi:hypothetical protein
MKRRIQYQPYFFAFIVIVGFVAYIYSLLNGYDPLGCPPGTKTISKPLSLEKWCVQE